MLQKSLKISSQKKEFSTSSIRSRNKLLQFNSIRPQTSKKMSLIVTIQMRTSIVLKSRMTKALTLHQKWERMTQKCSKLFQIALCQKESRFHALIPATSRLYRMMTSWQKQLRFNKSGSTILWSRKKSVGLSSLNWLSCWDLVSTKITTFSTQMHKRQSFISSVSAGMYSLLSSHLGAMVMGYGRLVYL